MVKSPAKKRVQDRQLPTRQQQVDLVRAFVGIDDLGVEHEPGDVVVDEDTVATPAFARQLRILARILLFIAQGESRLLSIGIDGRRRLIFDGDEHFSPQRLLLLREVHVAIVEVEASLDCFVLISQCHRHVAIIESSID